MFRTIISISLILLLAIATVSAQERDSLIVISPQVGETIDRQERDLYGLFPASQDFQSAVIYPVSDSNYVAEITEKMEDRLCIRRLNIDQEEMDLIRSQLGIFTHLGSCFQAKENPILVILDSQYREWEGRLLGCHADSVLLGDPQSLSEFQSKHIFIHDIQEITRRKSANVMDGCATGLLIGGLIGAVVGFAQGDDKPGIVSSSAEEKALIVGIPLGLLGGCVGGAGKIKEGKDQHFNLTQMSYRQKIDLLIRLSGL